MHLRELRLSGTYEIQLPFHSDHRGLFVKSFCRSAFASHGLEIDFSETFYTVSKENVIRGMHFQTPPHDHAKLVYCISGRVLDFALDLRVGSPSYGLFESLELDSARFNAAYLPRVISHGFAVLEAPAVMAYHVSSEHAPAADSGVHWDSFGATWPSQATVVSNRDAGLLKFEEFVSPFVFSMRVPNS